MLYSDLYLHSQSRPPRFLYAVAVLAVSGFLYYFAKLPQVPIQASKLQTLNHSIVNLAQREAGVYWETSTKSVGWISWGESPDKLDNTALDERDLKDVRTPFRYHFVRLPDLKEGTNYYYKIVSNKEVASADGGKPFSFQTLNAAATQATAKPVYGKTLLPNSDPAVNIIVSLHYPGALPLVTLTKIDGAWMIPLTYLVDKESGKLIDPAEEAVLTIEMESDDAGKTAVKAGLGQASPVPQTVVLGTNYDFTKNQEVLSAATSGAQLKASFEPQILFPKEKSIIPGKNPLVKGITSPFSEVAAIFSTSPPITRTAMSDGNGNWILKDVPVLDAGSYNLTVKTVDSKGKNVVLKRSFSIAKSGEQVLAAATGSATVTPTRQPTLQPTLPVTQPPQATPTTIVPTTVYATATPVPPVSGESSTYLLGGSALMIIIGAGMLFFL